jgi:hypothetical protein
MRDDERFEHRIYLLSGLSRLRLAAVGAHEYTHAWLRENIAKDRQIDGDTVEGFCELVAYKLMVLRGEEREQKVIQANLYSRGQITLLQAEATMTLPHCQMDEDSVDDKIRERRLPTFVLRNSSPGCIPAKSQHCQRSSSCRHHREQTAIRADQQRTCKNEEAVIRVKPNLGVPCLGITEVLLFCGRRSKEIQNSSWSRSEAGKFSNPKHQAPNSKKSKPNSSTR